MMTAERQKIGTRLRQVPISAYLTYSITTRRLGSTPVEWIEDGDIIKIEDFEFEYYDEDYFED